jgi:isopenicillin N synthase-like dioxygenase
MRKTLLSFLYCIVISCAMFQSTFAMDFMERHVVNSAGLPIIDVQNPDASKLFMQSLREKGFALIKKPNPSIDILGLKEEWQPFFAKTDAEKCVYHKDLSPIGLGYYPLGIERAEGATEQNFMEYYHYATDHTLPEGLSGKTEDYFSAMREVKIMLTKWIDEVHAAEGFLLPERIRNGGVNTEGVEIQGVNSVEEMAELDLHSNIVRIIHYPAVSEDIGRVVNVAHTDISALSLLFATEPGLQLLGRDGLWYDVGGDPDVLVVNAGDMLMWGTDGDRPGNSETGIKSTVHRVIRANDRARFAFAAFFGVKPWLQIQEKLTASQAFFKRINGNLTKADEIEPTAKDSDIVNTTTDGVKKLTLTNEENARVADMV